MTHYSALFAAFAPLAVRRVSYSWVRPISTALDANVNILGYGDVDSSSPDFQVRNAFFYVVPLE